MKARGYRPKKRQELRVLATDIQDGIFSAEVLMEREGRISLDGALEWQSRTVKLRDVVFGPDSRIIPPDGGPWLAAMKVDAKRH